MAGIRKKRIRVRRTARTRASSLFQLAWIMAVVPTVWKPVYINRGFCSRQDKKLAWPGGNPGYY
jgi:hypothetical protein